MEAAGLGGEERVVRGCWSWEERVVGLGSRGGEDGARLLKVGKEGRWFSFRGGELKTTPKLLNTYPKRHVVSFGLGRVVICVDVVLVSHHGGQRYGFGSETCFHGGRVSFYSRGSTGGSRGWRGTNFRPANLCMYNHPITHKDMKHVAHERFRVKDITFKNMWAKL